MNIQPEFSFIVNCDSLKETEKTFEIEADEEERAALAKRFNLISLDSLKAKAVVSRESADLVRLRCEFSADIVQQCIVTSAPLKNSMKLAFERVFSASAKAYFGSDTEPDEEYDSNAAPEPPDPMTDGGFDLGETVAEQLLLEIDPFPRSANASFEGFSSSGDDGDGGKRVSPFAVLEQLKKKS